MTIAMPTAMDTVVPPILIELGERIRIRDLVGSIAVGDARSALALVDGSRLDRAALGALSTQRETSFQLVRQQDLQIILMAWLPGQFGAPQSHPGSKCDFRVLKGIATEQRFAMTSGGGVTLIEEDRYLPGSIVSWNSEDIHAMGNDADRVDLLLTLHVYKPAPIKLNHELASGGVL